MSDDKYLWLEFPIHTNYFSSKSYSPSEEAKSNMMITIDGTVMAVKESYIKESLGSEHSKMVRLGFEKPPKSIALTSDDDLKVALSYQQYSE
jgi:hypothetical protein